MPPAVFEKFSSVIRNQYPDLKALAEKDSVTFEKRLRPLIADHVIELPLSFYKAAQDTIHTLFHASRAPERLKFLHQKFLGQQRLHEISLMEEHPNNLSVLMAYDFHYDFTTGKTSLIEINTNASAYLMAEAAYRAHNVDPYASSHSPLKGLSPLEVLMRSIERDGEMALQKRPRAIAIIDEGVEHQKMYYEFLMYRNLFRQRGYEAEIFEFDRVPLDGKYDFVYNRYTDFLFLESKSRPLLEAYKNGNICLSPQPYEYLILSHKERLIEFAEDSLAPTLIPTMDIKSLPPEILWERRKNLFFKPKASFGSKAAYKGASITRKTFDDVIHHEYIAQEFRPPGTIGEWKFDIRCYAYADEIQLVIARVYQGQVTNFGTPGGGLAPVKFI